MNARKEALIRTGLFTAILILLTGSTTALSCAMVENDILSIHCPEASSCSKNLNASGSDRANIYLEAENIPDSGHNTTKNVTEGYRNGKWSIRTTESRELPSAKSALNKARSMCPTPQDLHAYPKSEFQRDELKDTTRCYRTEVEEIDDYFLVWREGTTENWNCVEKVRGERVTGGGTHYTDQAGLKWIIGKLISSIIPF